MPDNNEKHSSDLIQILGPKLGRLNLRDLSLLPLLVSNGLAIWWAARDHLSLQTVMMIYWSQSVAIGAVNVLRILALREYSTEDLRMGGPLSPSAGTKLKIAGFFVLHYGFFHVVYLVFILAALALHWNAETRGRNIGTVMFAPYARIVPMHLAIIFGGFVNYHPGLTLGLFQRLKTVADVFAHLVQHRRTARS